MQRSGDLLDFLMVMVMVQGSQLVSPSEGLKEGLKEGRQWAECLGLKM